MKKGALIAVIVILLIIAVGFFLGFFDKIIGNVVSTPVSKAYCYETDGGDNQFVAGNMSYSYKYYEKNITRKNVPDKCFYGNIWLLEYYCDAKSMSKTKQYKCDKGCINGACLK